jgi:hypothetical protein
MQKGKSKRGHGSAFEAEARWGHGERRSRTSDSCRAPYADPEDVVELVGDGLDAAAPHVSDATDAGRVATSNCPGAPQVSNRTCI